VLPEQQVFVGGKHNGDGFVPLLLLEVYPWYSRSKALCSVAIDDYTRGGAATVFELCRSQSHPGGGWRCTLYSWG
jgi:hypothetical protein